jgi:hypothetical protein
VQSPANKKHGAAEISEDADTAYRGDGVHEFFAGAKLKGSSGVAILDREDRIPSGRDSPLEFDRKNSALVIVASQTAGTSPLCKADVPVFFDNMLITSRRDTLKQDNTMVTGSYNNQRFNMLFVTDRFRKKVEPSNDERLKSIADKLDRLNECFVGARHDLFVSEIAEECGFTEGQTRALLRFGPYSRVEDRWKPADVSPFLRIMGYSDLLYGTKSWREEASTSPERRSETQGERRYRRRQKRHLGIPPKRE